MHTKTDNVIEEPEPPPSRSIIGRFVAIFLSWVGKRWAGNVGYDNLCPRKILICGVLYVGAYVPEYLCSSQSNKGK